MFTCWPETPACDARYQMHDTMLTWRGTVCVCERTPKPGSKSHGPLHFSILFVRAVSKWTEAHRFMSRFLRCMAWNSKASCLFTHTAQASYLTVLPPSSRASVNPVTFSLENKRDAALQATDVKTAYYWLCSHEVRWSGQNVFTAIIEYTKAFDLIPPTWPQEIFYVY